MISSRTSEYVHNYRIAHLQTAASVCQALAGDPLYTTSMLIIHHKENKENTKWETFVYKINTIYILLLHVVYMIIQPRIHTTVDNIGEYMIVYSYSSGNFNFKSTIKAHGSMLNIKSNAV